MSSDVGTQFWDLVAGLQEDVFQVHEIVIYSGGNPELFGTCWSVIGMTESRFGRIYRLEGINAAREIIVKSFYEHNLTRYHAQYGWPGGEA